METEKKSLDPQLWHACAGSMVQIPTLNSTVFYFPQGHAEHTNSSVNFGASLPQIPSQILCRVASLKYLADSETDEVYVKLKLFPLGNKELDLEDDMVLGVDNQEKPASFAKTLTQSDANNGGGFSVPRYCAETIFPKLDYTADPPVQTVMAKDVHGEMWKFRHIYRGTPRRHLLTTGWSSFVNQKKLVAGDSIVFLRAENGDLCIGIRRAKRGIGGLNEYEPHSGWNSSRVNNPYGGFSVFLREDDGKVMRKCCNGNLNMNGNVGVVGSSGGFIIGKGRVRPEDVLEAVALAASGQSFEIVYYPRASTPEFCVKASTVRAAMRIHWCSGMRFKMPFETEDSSRISWFMGTISSVQAADPIRWPNSPWRILQVTWDEPDLLHNVKQVNPWLVELVSNVPVINLSPFSPAKKKLRLPQDFSLDGQFPMPSFSGNPLGPSSSLCFLSDNTSAGIQGARHPQIGISLPDLQLHNKLQSGLLLSSFQRFDPRSRASNGITTGHPNRNENLSCSLTMGNISQNLEKSDGVKRHHFFLFGQPILTEQQISIDCSSDSVSQVLDGKSFFHENPDKAKKYSDGSGSVVENRVSPEKTSGTGFPWHQGFRTTEPAVDTGHCKVFMESEDVGRTLDLSVLGSYEELYRRLANMFGIERSDMLSHVLYRDASGAVKQTGDEPFSDFMRTAKRLTIKMNLGSGNVGRTWITGIRNAENGLDASSKTGPMNIPALHPTLESRC
ncbi:AUX_IAA domain-containing protein/B3 domain-containing protein/Auxin_resp domain-containing protein [Cephalotus follicularis]|uniref:Auxin response factor n=1 Tax=Cephalotus follicularis TaxID=3775 RepID=A0A1Q3BF00_CEPFO|nr:AUX_IAA domain-containing protein/B3 domain-containing protein/Auxin_resp domain-containing protein [Cephalotus follicularis]